MQLCSQTSFYPCTFSPRQHSALRRYGTQLAFKLVRRPGLKSKASSCKARCNSTLQDSKCSHQDNSSRGLSSKHPTSARSNERSRLWTPFRLSAETLLAACAACWLCQAQPALAELQTVAPSSVTEVAKPLKAQPVNKSKVWLLFGAGAAGVLTTAILLEKNPSLFPAIAKANEAMRMAQQMRDNGEDPDAPIETSIAQQQEDPSQSAFAAGLKQASEKAKSQSSPSPSPELPSSSQAIQHADNAHSPPPTKPELQQEAQDAQQAGEKQLQPKR